MAINPLQPPINYAGMVPQINIGQQFAELGQVLAERQKRTQAEEVKELYKTDLQAVLDNPSMKAFNEFSLKYPQQREVVKDVANRFTQEQQDAEFNVGRDVAVSLENKNPDVALNILNQAIDARKNSNLSTTAYDQIKQILSNTDDPDRIKKAQAQTNFSLTLLNPEKFGKVVESLEKQRLAPSTLTEAIGKANEAVAKATTAQATAENAPDKAKADAALAKAQAEKAQVEAKYAERVAVDAIIKRGADLGLTTAQTNEVLVRTRNLGIETKKAVLQLKALEASGGLDPAKTFEQEEKLRKEYQGRTKVYGELGTTFSNIKSSADAKTGPGDIALITGFMKMLDPGSVVRETEFATARDTAGLYDRLLNTSQKLQSGQLFTLDSKQRTEYVNLAKQYLDSAQKKAGEDKKALEVVVKNYKLNPDNVFGPETAAPPSSPSPNSVIVNGQTFNRPANFTDAQWSAYKQSVGAQ
jgi:hypothetical protein